MAAGSPRHPAVAVGGAGDHSLEEAEDAPHGGYVVERGHEVHLGGPGIGEAHVDAGVDERREEGSGTVHLVAPGLVAASAWVDGAGLAEQSAGTEDALRVEHALDGSHEFERRGILELQEERQLGRADSVFARYGAAGVDRRPQDLAFECVPLLRVGLEHAEVHVAVADVAAARDEGAVLARQLGHPCQVVGDGGTGDDGIDDVVGPRGLRHEEQPLPGHDEVRAGVRRQDVDVDGIEGFEQCPQLLDVFLEPDRPTSVRARR